MFSGGEQAIRYLNKIKSNEDDYCPHSMLFSVYINKYLKAASSGVDQKDHKNSNNKS